MSEASASPPRSIPWAGIVATLSLIAGIGCGVGGVYLLAGAGWALIAAATPCLMLGAVVVRGLLS